MLSENVAVIGGTGFLGSNLVVELLKAGYTPVVVARTPDKVGKVLPGVDVEVRRGDLTDLDSLRSALRGCAVVHSVAALMNEVFVSPKPDLLEAAIRVNVEGTLNVLRAARGVGARRVVVTSTASTRYQPGGALANEDSPSTAPNVIDDAYVRSKVLEEAAVANFARETDQEVVSILPGGMVGPGDGGPTPLGAALVAYLNGQASIGIEGAFPVVDVRDVARAHIAAMEHSIPGKPYLMVARTISLREWYGLLNRLTGLTGPRVFLPPSITMFMAYFAETVAQVMRKIPRFTRNQVRHIVQAQKFDCSRAQYELGITFTPIETALRDTVTWYVENGWVSHPERLTLATSGAGIAQEEAVREGVSSQ